MHSTIHLSISRYASSTAGCGANVISCVTWVKWGQRLNTNERQKAGCKKGLLPDQNRVLGKTLCAQIYDRLKPHVVPSPSSCDLQAFASIHPSHPRCNIQYILTTCEDGHTRVLRLQMARTVLRLLQPFRFVSVWIGPDSRGNDPIRPSRIPQVARAKACRILCSRSALGGSHFYGESGTGLERRGYSSSCV
jgi:hypothetical protein